MKVIILAAGYATRLYPLTKNIPKPLLPVGDKPILEHIIGGLNGIKEIDDIIIITNHKFYNDFLLWNANFECEFPITLIDDGTMNNETRHGAIRDIKIVIDELDIDDEIMVLAGDNLYDFSLHGFVEYYFEIKKSCIMVHEESDINKLRKTGVALISEGSKVLGFEEKPPHPKSNYAVPPFYIYTVDTLPLFTKYIDEGNNPDAPGNFIAWLCKNEDVYAYKMNGHRYDIGDLASYNKVKELYDR